MVTFLVHRLRSERKVDRCCRIVKVSSIVVSSEPGTKDYCSFSMNNTNNNCNNRFGLDFDKTISSEFRFFLLFARLFLFYGFGLLKRSSEQFPLVAGNSRCCRLPANNTVFKDFSLSAFLSSNRNF